MKKFSSTDMIALLIWFVPIGYLLKIYSSLPASVPLHFGMDGKPDRYGSPTEFLVAVFALSGVSVLVYLLLKFLPLIDPKKTAKYSQSTFNKLAVALVIFFSVIVMCIIYATTNNGFDITKLLFPMMGLLFAFLGNLMYNIKPNYFAGIRTPWTLESEATWKATHRLAAKLWFPGGIIITLLSLFASAKISFIVFISITVIISIIPVVFSYIHFKKNSAKNIQ